MRKLICATEVEALYKTGQHIISIDRETIITPSAKDLIKEYQIDVQNSTTKNLLVQNIKNKDKKILTSQKLVNETKVKSKVVEKDSTDIGESLMEKLSISETDIANMSEEDCSKELLLSFLRNLLHGKPTDMFYPYVYQKHESGLKLIKGNTICPQPTHQSQVKYQEIVSTDESQQNIGVLEMENVNYSEKTISEKIYYVISGKIEITIDESNYVGEAGDTIVIPKNCLVQYLVTNKAIVWCSQQESVSK